MQDTKDTLPNKEQKFLFGSPNVSSSSFQSIANSSLSNSLFGKKPTSGNSLLEFPESGTKLFTTPDRSESKTKEDHEGPHFEPIIPLPEKIDVKTGEEDEEVMFSHRAKLYRFVAEDKQWKERGVGDIKLLKNRRSAKIRVLMRRDQVLKICANHQITAEMKLKPNAGSERSWVWSTMADFSEQECRAEQLAVRFKSKDIAKQFKEKFEECQEMLKNSTLMESRVQPKSTDAKEDLVAKFRLAEGSWECSACMVNNDSNKVACTACGSVKAEPSQGQKEETKPLFEFGSGASFSGGGFTFGSGGINQGGDTKPAFTYGGSNKTTNPCSGFSFSFGTLKQGGIVSDQQSKATKSSFSSLFEPKPGNKAGNSKYDNERQEKPKNQTSVKAKKEETKTQQAEKGIMANFKADKSSWECSVCMVQNDKDKVTCLACGCVKARAKPTQGLKKEAKPSFSLGSSSLTIGEGFTFGRGGKSQQSKTKPVFNSDSLNQTLYLGTGFSFKPGGGFSNQQSKDINGSLSSLYKQKPGKKADNIQDDHNRQEMLKNQLLLITTKDEKKNEDTGKGVIAQFKNATGSWECNICMVNNDSDKVECAACGSIKSGAEVIKAQKQDSKSLFPIGFGTSSSGGVFSFGSGGTSQGDSKPVFTFGSHNQTSTPSSGVVFGFCSSDQGGNLSGQQTNTTPKSLITAKDGTNNEDTRKDAIAKFQPAKGSWECEICMVNNDGDKFACAACGSVKPAVGVHKEQKQDSKSLFPFGFGASSSGGVFSFGSGRTTQGESKPIFTFGSRNSTSSPSSGVLFSFGSSDQGGNLSGQQTKTTLRSLITTKDGKKDGETRKDVMTKFQPAKGSWECEICMVNNDSNKVECAACGSVKPAVGAHKEQKQDSKSLFPIGFGTSSSGGVFSFGSGRASQGDSKPVFTFGSHNQTSTPSSGVVFGFCSSDQGGNLSGQQTNTTPKSLITAKDGKNNEDTRKDAMAKFQPSKGSWECEICMVNNDSDKVQCAACGSVKPAVGVHKEQKQDSKSLFPFGFGASSSGGVFSFGSDRTTQGNSKPVFTFGSLNQTSSPSSGVAFGFGSLDQGGNLSGQ